MMVSSEKFKQILYGYWAKRFACQQTDFDRTCTKFVKEDGLVEKGKAYIYHIKNMRVVRMAPDLVSVIDDSIAFNKTRAQITEKKIQTLLGKKIKVSLENTLIDYFLDSVDFTPFRIMNGFTARQIDPQVGDDILRAFYGECSAEDLDEAEIYIDEPDPVIFGLFENDQMVAYASHRYWDSIIADIGVLVHPGIRSRGLGKAVVSRICEWCIQNDVIPMYRVFDGNTHSLRIPAALGFKEKVIIDTFIIDNRTKS